MGITMVLSLLSGVALFLYGMALMGDSLKKVAGNKLELILYKLTNSPIKGLLLGTVVTAIIQSSSATTVMVVGFVNSGMMKVAQAIGIIMGANIGTSITGWILCLSYIDGSSGIAQLLSTATISAIVAIIGIIFRTFVKKKPYSDIGDIMLGFAILMFGMQTMSGAVSPLKENPHFVSLLTMFKNPFMGILVGIAFTAVLQSASASVGILQALSITGSITFAAALPITMGIGVGAACPVLLSSIGTNKNGKRTALIYLLNDLFGMIFWSIVFYSVNAAVHFTFMDMVMSPVNIALLNSVFRIATILILAPFISKIEKLVFFLIKDTDEDNEEQADFDLLEERFLDYPPLAISQSQMAVNGMAKNARKNLMRAFELLTDFSDSKFNKIQEKENMIDKYEDKLGTYLMQLSMHDMTPEQAKQTSKFLHTISDFERLGDHAVNISRVAQELHEKSRTFSESATYELNVLEKALVEIVDLTVNSFVDEDLDTAAKVEPLRELIGILCNDLKLRHIKRLRNGQCNLNTGFAFNDLLTNYERIAAHCSNVAVAILELDSSNFDIHEYTKSVRKLKDETYLTAFEEYEKKYDINGYQPEAEADKKFSAKAKDSEKDKDNEKSSGKKKDKDKKKDKKKSQKSKKNSKKTKNSTAKKKETSTTTAKKKKVKKKKTKEKTTKTKNTKETTKTTTASKNESTVQTAENQTTEAKQEQSCEFLISCKTVLSNKSALQSNYQVPAGGKIYEKKMEFEEGDTVMDVLKRTGVDIDISKGYVAGIDGLYEFDCGKNSGWMYRVNGKFPNYMAGKCKLHDGDKVEWLYTCVRGDL